MSAEVIATYRDPMEAELARATLEGNGIDAFLLDAETVRINWFYSNLVGGIKLAVRPEDAARAGEILSAAPAALPEEVATEDDGPAIEPLVRLPWWPLALLLFLAILFVAVYR